MKNTFALLLVLGFSFCSFSQTIVKKHLSSCDKNSNPYYIKNRIVSKRFSGDTLYLTVGFTENCGGIAKPILKASNDTLFLRLPRPISDVHVFCDCCFELELTITGVSNENFVLVYPHSYSFHDFSDKSITEKDTLLNEVLTEQTNKFFFPLEREFKDVEIHNQLTAEGLRTGLWYKYDTTRVRLRKVVTLKHATLFAPPESGKESALWSVHFKNDGTIAGVSAYNPYQGSWMEIDGPMYYRLIGKTE